METTTEPVDPNDVGLSEMEDLTTPKSSSQTEVIEEVESDDDPENGNNVEKMDVADA